MDYELQVYVCSGSDKEKLDWFRTINIAGERLTDQELRNAVFAGPWLADAKRHFSKTGCAAYGLGSNYVNGSPIRQDYLETALRWIAASLTKDGHTESIEGEDKHKPMTDEQLVDLLSEKGYSIMPILCHLQECDIHSDSFSFIREVCLSVHFLHVLPCGVDFGFRDNPTLFRSVPSCSADLFDFGDKLLVVRSADICLSVLCREFHVLLL